MIVLEAKVILNNIFGSPELPDFIRYNSINIKDVEQCSIFISNNLPGYVVCDLSDDAVEHAVKTGEIEYDHSSGDFRLKHEIDREKYNRYYPKETTEKLKKIIDWYFKRKLYNRKIEPIKTLIG